LSTHLTVMTYDDKDRWVDAFVKPNGLNLLFMVGNPGTGKSASFKAKLDEAHHHYINAARLTSFQLYKLLFAVRNKAIILDDVDDALRRADMARLLMSLCESDNQARIVAWLGTESLLKVKKGKMTVPIPQEFETTSRICVICNDWNILTTKFGALLDRGTVVFFDPDAEAIHRFVGQWFQDDAEIYTFVGERLADIPQHSIRYYINAKDHKRLGLDWKAALLESWTSDRPRVDAAELLVRQLLEDATYQSDKERIAQFEAHQDGGSRRTWFNIKKKLNDGTHRKHRC
jgi:hypothetical protein